MDILKHLEKYGYAIQKNVISSKDCIKMSQALDSLKLEKEKMELYIPQVLKL